MGMQMQAVVFMQHRMPRHTAGQFVVNMQHVVALMPHSQSLAANIQICCLHTTCCCQDATCGANTTCNVADLQQIVAFLPQAWGPPQMGFLIFTCGAIAHKTRKKQASFMYKIWQNFDIFQLHVLPGDICLFQSVAFLQQPSQSCEIHEQVRVA